VYLALLLACARFVHIWLGLRRILRLLEQHPMQRAFKRLGNNKDLSPALVWRFGGGRRTDVTLMHSIGRLRTLVAQAPLFVQPGLLGCGAEELKKLKEAVRDIASGSSKTGPNDPENSLTKVSNCLIQHSLHSAWWDKGSANRVAEEFVALRFVAVIRYGALHLKNLLEFVAGGLILAIVSFMCYPFEPHHLIMTAISTCFFVMSAVFLFAFVQLNRDTIISYLNGTKPGKIDANLWHVASIGALPLVTVLAAQFPTIGGFLFAWVKPALENLR